MLDRPVEPGDDMRREFCITGQTGRMRFAEYVGGAIFLLAAGLCQLDLDAQLDLRQHGIEAGIAG